MVAGKDSLRLADPASDPELDPLLYRGLAAQEKEMVKKRSAPSSHQTKEKEKSKKTCSARKQKKKLRLCEKRNDKRNQQKREKAQARLEAVQRMVEERESLAMRREMEKDSGSCTSSSYSSSSHR